MSFTLSIYNKVADLPQEARILPENERKLFLCEHYFAAIEHSATNELELRYAVFRNENNRVIGLITFQITHFTTSPDAYSNVIIKSINRFLTFIRRGHVHNILICGNAFATGEHGYVFTEGVSDEERAGCIYRAMREIEAQEKHRGRRICAMLVKDFYPNSLAIPDQLTKYGFKSFQVDHNMVMPIDNGWNKFEDYLNDMNTKFRTKAKAAIKRSAGLKTYSPDEEEVQRLLPEMKELYTAVQQKADFRLGKMDLGALPWLVSSGKEKGFYLKCYELDGKLVGFSTAMKCGNTLEAHIIGIDYNTNREYAVYQKILYDFVDYAIATKCSRIVFGRTAAEIKSSIGAMPVNLTCSILHSRKISNALLSMIVQYIKPSEYPHREPFKSETEEKLKKISLY